MPEQKPLNSEKLEKPSINVVIRRNEKGQILPGQQSLNPLGKPAGTDSFKTKWLKFIDKVAKWNNISTDEVDEQLLAVAFKQAKAADYPFYKDIQDRVYGKAQDNLDLTTQGQKITPENKEEAKAAIQKYLNDNPTDIANKQSSADTPVVPVQN